jgi:hypothetical protein
VNSRERSLPRPGACATSRLFAVTIKAADHYPCGPLSHASTWALRS